MTVATQQRPAVEEMRRAMDEGGLEFVDGEIISKPESIHERRVLAHFLCTLHSAVHNQKLGDVLAGQPFRCRPNDPEGFRKPDLVFISAHRAAGLLRSVDVIDVPGELAVEVLCPRDTAEKIEEKVQEYFAFGFSVMWIVHPEQRLVIVRRADRSATELHAEDDITGEDFLPGFKCKVGAFFE